MKALRLHGYGGPECLRLDDVPVPAPGEGFVLLKVRAASVNPIDWKMRAGLLSAVFPLALPRTLGRDCAGESGGTLYAGVADVRTDGTHAEYAVLPRGQAAEVPAGIPAEAAASLCVAGVSAWIPLAEVAAVKPGMKVLVHAGAGGVGSLAIQLARHLGADVAATASARNRDYCLALGATSVVDYRTERLPAGAYDVVLDTIGGDTHVRSLEALQPGGTLVALQAAPIPPHARRPDVRVATAQIQPTTGRLGEVLRLAAQGVLKPQVTRTLPLSEGARAYVESEAGHARGKIVLLPA